jgi:hypothetical protein
MIPDRGFPMIHITQLATVLKTLLIDEANTLAKEFHVIKRCRIFTGSSLVQTLLFGWLNQPRASIDQLAQMAAKCNAPVTKTALEKRFTPELAQLLRRLIERGVELMMKARHPRALPLLKRFTAVVLQDSTVVSLPDALKDEWPGCGGKNGQTAAAMKIQVQYDLLKGSLMGLKLEPGKTPDQGTTLTAKNLPVGTLHIADLGYFDLKRLKDLVRRVMYFLSRIQVGTAVFDKDGNPLDLWKWLNHQLGNVVDCRIQLGAEQRLGCRLLALRCPADVVRLSFTGIL